MPSFRRLVAFILVAGVVLPGPSSAMDAIWQRPSPPAVRFDEQAILFPMVSATFYSLHSRIHVDVFKGLILGVRTALRHFRQLNSRPVPVTPVLMISTADMIALKVRMKPIGGEKPKHLYQAVPIALLSGLPLDEMTLSIPTENFPIVREAPSSAGGVVIDYQLVDNQYIAKNIVSRGRAWDARGFVAGILQQAIRAQSERGETRFIYCAPSWQQWGTIFGSAGYVAVRYEGDQAIALGIDPIASPHSDPTSGLVIRVPALRRSAPHPLYTYVHPEILISDFENRSEQWVSFGDYQAYQSRRSEFPVALDEPFQRWLDHLAAEVGAVAWDFGEGSLYAHVAEWWRNRNVRMTDHEGTDFYRFVDAQGQRCAILAGTPVRAVAPGRVVQLFDDVIGRTVVVRHSDIRQTIDGVEFTLHSLYVHVSPLTWIGAAVSPEQKPLGVVAAPKNPDKGSPPHLHLSFAWIPRGLRPTTLNWDRINPNFSGIYLIDPLSHQVLQASADAQSLQLPTTPLPKSSAEHGRELWLQIKNHPEKYLKKISALMIGCGYRLMMDDIALVWPRQDLAEDFFITTLATLCQHDLGIVPLLGYALTPEQKGSLQAYLSSRSDRFMSRLVLTGGEETLRREFLTTDFWVNFYRFMPSHHRVFDLATHPFIIERATEVIVSLAAAGQRLFKILQDGCNNGDLLNQLADHLLVSFPEYHFQFLGTDLSARALGSERRTDHLLIRTVSAIEPLLLGEGPFDLIIDDGMLTKSVIAEPLARIIIARWDSVLNSNGTIFSIPYARYSLSSGPWLAQLKLPASWRILGMTIPEHVFERRHPMDFLVIRKTANTSASAITLQSA